ncbi:MAG: UDP-N-acetylmuramoyl-tripeptide--D-alanyl-D-alanine ligase [Crocinitomicaceae bacterium]|nr:UDP-N-acetylmuramoyl-tripeptide--D-alanyl-D-alanine ligase [Crocinitomicaceae bacterium]MDG2464482.1 UDP-N-acetylmuramoyl-tripeptide--D-alanyl-D-alanine ligase [Crocinitomicaceae bacterium]
MYHLFLSTSGVCTDTRAIEKDCLFIALKGTNFNGNTFSEEALKVGAKYAIVDEKEYQTNENIILVDDALKFLQDLALYHRRQFSIPVIGITGSNGKTTNKELMAAVLQKKYKTHFTYGNLNNHIGVPLTLLKLKKEHEIAIIEMGANKYKDIEELCDIAEPNYGIITNIGKAHLEGLGGFEGVLRTKKELFDAVEKSKGTLIYNADDSVISGIVPSSTTNYSFSKNVSTSFIIGNLIELTPFVKLKWSVEGYESPEITTNLVGEYNFYNFLAAIAFGVLFDVPNDDINIALSKYVPSNNRSQVLKTTLNTLIVDCYNANPSSMRSALTSFSQIDHNKKIAVLGDMRELGDDEIPEHQDIIELLEELSLDAILVGGIFDDMNSTYLSFPSVEDLNEYLQTEIIKGTMILLKGSRGIQLEKAIYNL